MQQQDVLTPSIILSLIPVAVTGVANRDSKVNSHFGRILLSADGPAARPYLFCAMFYGSFRGRARSLAEPEAL